MYGTRVLKTDFPYMGSVFVDLDWLRGRRVRTGMPFLLLL